MIGTAAPVEAAVFDCDGLLVDSSATWARSFASAAGNFGLLLDEETQTHLLGASVSSGAALLASLLTDAPVAELERLIQVSLLREVDRDAPTSLPGADYLLGHLFGRIPLAVASNGPRELVELMLDRAGLRDAFAHIVTSSDVGAAKPLPLVYLEACQRLGAAPKRSVGFEDSMVGAAAVLNAGMRLVLVNGKVVPGLEMVRHLTGHMRVNTLDASPVLELFGVRALEPSAP